MWLIYCLWLFLVSQCLYFRILDFRFNQFARFQLSILTSMGLGSKLVNVNSNIVLLSNTYCVLYKVQTISQWTSQDVTYSPLETIEQNHQIWTTTRHLQQYLYVWALTNKLHELQSFNSLYIRCNSLQLNCNFVKTTHSQLLCNSIVITPMKSY